MKVILYTKNFNKDITEKVDVILSPQFYWIKKLEMKVSLREAKKISKNLFKLDEEEYIFSAFKIDNKIFAVAVKKDLNLKIDKKYINSVRLAQIELYHFDCIDVGDYLIKKIDDILFCFPKKNETCKKIDEILNNIKLSKQSFNLFNVINVDKNILFYLISSLIIFNLFFFIEGFGYKQELTKIEKEKSALQKYNLPLSLYQLNAIYEALKNENEKQNKIKKVLSFLSKLRNFEFQKIEFNNGVFTISIKTDKKLDGYFKNFNILSSEIKNKIYTLKVKI